MPQAPTPSPSLSQRIKKPGLYRVKPVPLVYWDKKMLLTSMRLNWSLLVAFLIHLFSSFSRMSKLSKPYWRYQKNYIQCRTCDLRLFRTHTGLVSFRGSCRNKDGYQLCSYKPLWNQCPWLVKRCSSYCCRWSSHQTGLFPLLLKLLCVVHQHPSAKLRRLLCLLHQ